MEVGNEAKEKVRVMWMCVCVCTRASMRVCEHMCVRAIDAVCVCFREERTKARRLK